MSSTRNLVCLGLLTVGVAGWTQSPAPQPASPGHQEVTPSASTTAMGHSPVGARDGNRFGTESGHTWRGAPGHSNWWWEVKFAQPESIGAILQITGDHEFVLRNAPRQYVWQVSDDELNWRDLPETRQLDERRTYRVHRLQQARKVRAIRLRIDGAHGEAPVLREIELYPAPDAAIAFPDWIVAVNTTHDATLPGHGQEFIPLARAASSGEPLEAQQVWLDAFTPEFVAAEPRPLAAFLSGNFKDWCEVDRSLWRGTSRILKEAKLPMWASCGGAQGLAILAETGIEQPWDCPHCRDPKRPRLPIYTHIGHTAGGLKCGDYSACIHERGPHEVVNTGDDPVFAGLPEAFQVMQSHCGQIEWPPRGWSLIATAGEGALTKTQCLRLDGRPIYAAQFHIELAGTPENSRIIMANFLNLARAWHQR
jgi:hypothetical protein